jgi:hypothetical protein
MPIGIPSIKKNYLRVYGTYGVFKTPNSNQIIRVFSTFANKKRGKDLLSELKPMRERVVPSDIKDLGSLLQRDLNDNRVAKSLVPYLLGKDGTSVAFFPSVLGVLIPKEFIVHGSNCQYPNSPIRTENQSTVTYNWEDKWFAELFKDTDDGSETTLGVLNIDLSQTEIVVIDGQHRANAFRVVTGTFSDKDRSTYKPFYELIDNNDCAEFDADLPVTIIWFETKDNLKIDPALISRRLFVDVNNTAKSVSNSRKILLNDRDPVALLTRFLYTKIAEDRGFSANSFSLLHGAFDSDSDLSKGRFHALTITNPEIIYDVFEKIFFKSWDSNTLDKYSEKAKTKFDSSRFNSFFGVAIKNNINNWTKNKDKEDDDQRLFFDESAIFEFQKYFNNEYCDIIINLLDNFKLYRLALAATKIIASYREDHSGEWTSDRRQEVWDKVFCGGEGLYYSYYNLKPKSQNSKSNTQSRSLDDLFNTITNIESEYETIRYELFKSNKIEKVKVDSAFLSLNTKAFQVGYFMAFFHFFTSNTNRDINAAYTEFMERLNKYSEIHWIYILNDFRQKLIGDVAPKSWPAYHKLFLRLIQNETEYFFEDKVYSPEAHIYKSRMDSWCKSHLIINNAIDNKDTRSRIDRELYSAQAKNVIKELSDLLKICGIDEMPEMETVYSEIDDTVLNLSS